MRIMGRACQVAVAVASLLLVLLYQWLKPTRVLPETTEEDLWKWLRNYDNWNWSSSASLDTNSSNASAYTNSSNASALLSGNPLEDYLGRQTSAGAITAFPHVLELYHRHLERFQGQRVKMLVLGLNPSGAEIGMWQKFFGPGLEFIGADNNPRAMFLEDVYENTTVYTGDVGDAPFLDAVKKKEETFDIIIDDASHLPADQILAFRTLFGALRPGGVYMVEDLHLSRVRSNFASFSFLLATTVQMGVLPVLGLLKIATSESFISFISSYASEMLREAGPFGHCFQHPAAGAQEPLISRSCAPVLAVDSLHIYTEMVVVVKRSEVRFSPEASFGR